jgi:hypothetical protein
MIPISELNRGPVWELFYRIYLRNRDNFPVDTAVQAAYDESVQAAAGFVELWLNQKKEELPNE